MTRSRTDWLLCRSNPTAPAGVVYFAGTFEGVGTLSGRVLVPAVSLFREEAATFDDAGAHLLAAMLTAFGPAADAARPWEAMPAQIHVPSPYRSQEKGPDERGQRAAVRSSSEVSLTLELISFAIKRDIGRGAIREALQSLGADNAETAELLRMSCLRS